MEVTLSQGTSTGAASSLASGSSQMGRNEFLSLLLAQLRYQSPLNPLQPHEFAAQLASFSSVEQMTQMNEALAQQTQGQDIAAVLAKATFGTSLVGRHVVASGNQVTIPSEGQGAIDIDVSGEGDAQIQLLNDAGEAVATRDLGHVSSGRQTLQLPDDLPEGTYTYNVTVESSDGSNVPVDTFVSGQVDSVRFEGGQIVLQIGEMAIPIESVMEVRAADAASTTTGDGASDKNAVADPALLGLAGRLARSVFANELPVS